MTNLETEAEQLRELQRLNAHINKLDAEVERLQADVAELSRVLNGIANRDDFADKVLERRRAALDPKS